jgi:hypothetical protein
MQHQKKCQKRKIIKKNGKIAVISISFQKLRNNMFEVSTKFMGQSKINIEEHNAYLTFTLNGKNGHV